MSTTALPTPSAPEAVASPVTTRRIGTVAASMAGPAICPTTGTVDVTTAPAAATPFTAMPQPLL